MLNSVALILQGLNAIEHEQYGNRLPAFATLEFDRIAGAINHLTEILEKARQDNNAMTIDIKLQTSVLRRSVVLAVNDDGAGCMLSGITTGFALMGIKARVNSLGGEVDFSSVASEGMAIYACIPVAS